jgi:hypothetical protein
MVGVDVDGRLKLPDLTAMLPEAARRALFDFFLAKLEVSKLNFYGDPLYRLVDALGDVSCVREGWIGSITLEQFSLAQIEYDRRHPKRWRSEGLTANVAASGSWVRD